jgi:hypothetical protein
VAGEDCIRLVSLECPLPEDEDKAKCLLRMCSGQRQPWEGGGGE